MSKLKGKRVVVTGSSMGIGQAVAMRLAREGAQVVINSRNSDALEATLKQITAAGGEAVACVGSVADFDFAGELINKCVDTFGGIDVLINCAGIAEPPGTTILDINPEDWQNLIDIHLTGTFNTCRQTAPLMVAQGHGTIINTSSHAFLGMYGGTGYAASKGATNSLSFTMAADLKSFGVDVNVICPGAKTRLSTGEEFEAHMRELHSKGTLTDERLYGALNPASPDYVASLYAVLASDYARGTTGQVFWGSGGYIGKFLPNEQSVQASMDSENSPPWEVDELAKALSLKPEEN